jgi:hypothetical protein
MERLRAGAARQALWDALDDWAEWVRFMVGLLLGQPLKQRLCQ